MPRVIADDFCRFAQVSHWLGSFPDLHKLMKLVGIPKKFKAGITNNLKKIRCISVGSAVDTAVQRLVEYIFQSFLIQNGLLSNRQHGFRKGCGVRTLYAELFCEINAAMRDGRRYAVILSYDCRNAFGSIPHTHLVVRLKQIFAAYLCSWLLAS